jgi:hypothetical protein
VLPSGADLTVSAELGLPPGRHVFGNLLITKGGTLACHPDRKKDMGVWIEARALTIEAGGHLSADREGRTSSGQGAASKGKPDHPAAPVSLGKPGGKGCAGGGAIRIDAKQAVIEGLLSANGESPRVSHCAGGGGGSIWLKCESLAGSGTIRADGGRPGGRGGRVAIYFRKGKFKGTCAAKGLGSKNDGTVLVNGRQ